MLGSVMGRTGKLFRHVFPDLNWFRQSLWLESKECLQAPALMVVCFTQPASLEPSVTEPQHHKNNPNTGENTRTSRSRTEPARTLTPPIVRVRNNDVHQNAPEHRHREARSHHPNNRIQKTPPTNLILRIEKAESSLNPHRSNHSLHSSQHRPIPSAKQRCSAERTGCLTVFAHEL